MTTGKRHIPINNHEPQAPAAAASDESIAGASDRGRPDVTSGSGSRGTGSQGAVPAEAAEHVNGVDAGTTEAVREGGTEDLASERDQLADSLLRLRAEFENFRRRAAREAIDARVRAQGDLMSDLLPVLDNLERALDAAEHHEEGKVLDGVRLTRNQFVDLLTRVGVEEIESAGVPFDPEVHEAMSVQPSEYDEGMVAAVLERGYRQGERLLRPARVIVSAGPGGSD